MKPMWVLHVDLDQFQAAVEVRRRPELTGLPIIVGGNGDPDEPRKVVTCASYPAREYGVRAGMPLRSAARKCPDAVFLPLNVNAYSAEINVGIVVAKAAAAERSAPKTSGVHAATHVVVGENSAAARGARMVAAQSLAGNMKRDASTNPVSERPSMRDTKSGLLTSTVCIIVARAPRT